MFIYKSVYTGCFVYLEINGTSYIFIYLKREKEDRKIEKERGERKRTSTYDRRTIFHKFSRKSQIYRVRRIFRTYYESRYRDDS